MLNHVIEVKKIIFFWTWDKINSPKIISTYWSRLFLIISKVDMCQVEICLIVFKLIIFFLVDHMIQQEFQVSKSTWWPHQEILHVFFEPLPIFYEPLCSVCLAGWHKARDPGLPKDFLLGFVLALCCCSQKNKILSEGALFFKAVFSQDFLQDS